MLLAMAQCLDAAFLRAHPAATLPRGGAGHILLAGHGALRRALAARGPDPATGAFLPGPLHLPGGAEAAGAGGGLAAAAVARMEMAAYRHSPPGPADDPAGPSARAPRSHRRPLPLPPAAAACPLPPAAACPST
jgi:hypothetical protein